MAAPPLIAEGSAEVSAQEGVTTPWHQGGQIAFAARDKLNASRELRANMAEHEEASLPPYWNLF